MLPYILYEPAAPSLCRVVRISYLQRSPQSVYVIFFTIAASDELHGRILKALLLDMCRYAWQRNCSREKLGRANTLQLLK
jgi:hypothetical protein